MEAKEAQSTNVEKYVHYIRTNIHIHVDRIREYQCQLWGKISSPRTFQRFQVQTGTLCRESPWRRIHVKRSYLKKQKSEEKSEDSMVSRIHQLVSGEPVK